MWRVPVSVGRANKGLWEVEGIEKKEKKSQRRIRILPRKGKGGGEKRVQMEVFMRRVFSLWEPAVKTNAAALKLEQGQTDGFLLVKGADKAAGLFPPF